MGMILQPYGGTIVAVGKGKDMVLKLLVQENNIDLNKELYLKPTM